MGFLPNVSEIGPEINCPRPVPRMKLEIINCALLTFKSSKSFAMSGKAGNIVSVPNAIIPNIIDTNIINSQ